MVELSSDSSAFTFIHCISRSVNNNIYMLSASKMADFALFLIIDKAMFLMIVMQIIRAGKQIGAARLHLWRY